MTKKDEAMRAVLQKRVRICDTFLAGTTLTPNERAFYLGKKEGLMQGHDLAGSTLKCITAELK